MGTEAYSLEGNKKTPHVCTLVLKGKLHAMSMEERFPAKLSSSKAITYTEIR